VSADFSSVPFSLSGISGQRQLISFLTSFFRPFASVIFHSRPVCPALWLVNWNFRLQSAGSILQQSFSSVVASAVRPYRAFVPVFTVFRLICPSAGIFFFNQSVQLIDPTTGISVCNGLALHTSQAYLPFQAGLSGPTDTSVHNPHPVLPALSFA
jgi:hypothetical protein